MNINVTKTEVSITNQYILNDKEYNVNKCYFTFSEEYTNELVKKAIFVQGTSIIEEPIINNECLIPSEVLNRGTFELRVYAYEVQDDELLLRYSPTPTLVYVRAGSYIEGAESPEVITPSQFEQYMQALNDGLNEVANVNIDTEQLSNGIKVIITDRTGIEKTVYVYNGEKGEPGATPNLTIGTVETGSPSNVVITGTPENPVLNFTLEKGEKGDIGQTGNGIESWEKTGTSGLIDTYTITFTDGDTTTINVTNGRGIVSIDLTSTVANVDTYTISYNDNTTSTFTVTNSTVTNQEFEELQNRVEYLGKYSNALIKMNNSGTNLTINDTVEAPMTISLAPSELSQSGTPTPDSPVTIHTISGDNTIVICNANLFNKNTVVGGYIQADGTVSSNTGYYTSDFIPIKPNTSYYKTKTGTPRSKYYDKNKQLLNTIEIQDISIGANEGTFTTPANAYYMRLSTRDTTILVDDVMVNTGTTALPFAEHQEQTLPLNLGDLEYCKIGDYADEFYLATESDTGLTAGKWYLKKYIGKRTIESLTAKDYNSSYKYFYGIAADMHKESSANVLFKGYSKIYQRTTSKGNADWGSKPDYVIGTRQTTTAICFKDSNYTDKTSFFNARGNEEIYYVLATPEYILLNDTIQSQLTEIYNWLLSYQDQTNISQVNNDLPFVINATTCYDLNKLLTRVEVLESEV